jgi:hypothetical protein
MKSVTCRELGGPCDERLSAATWDEMVTYMPRHVIEKHPDTARRWREPQGSPEQMGP